MLRVVGLAIEIELEESVEEQARLGQLWHVVLLDDDDHTYGYVVDMLMAVFGHAQETAYRMTVEVDSTGRAIVWTGQREVAEFKQERIHGFGADPALVRSAGSMTAVLEPAD